MRCQLEQSAASVSRNRSPSARMCARGVAPCWTATRTRRGTSCARGQARGYGQAVARRLG
jgi:hypothetical protein